MAADELNPPLGTTTPEIFLDNVKRADRLVNGPAGTVDDRGGEPLDTWRQMMAKNDEVRQNIIPLSKQYMTLEAAQADIANIPEGSTTYVRSPDGGTLADEYINNAGNLEPTGRAMLSEEGVGKIAQKAVDDIQKAQSTEGIAYSMTFSGGERSFLEFGYDGAPSEHSARLIMSPDNVNEEFQQAVLGRKEQNTQDVAYSMTFSGGERSFLEFGYDGAPSAASSKLIAGKLNLSETSQQFREDIQTLAGGGGSGSSRNLIAVQTAPQDSNFREYPKVRKISDAPIFTQADQSAASIYWPWFYDNSQHGGNGITLFYSTDHATVHANSGVFAATADTPEGPYTFHGLVFRDDAGGTQCETPCVMYDEKNQRFLMYYQMESVGVGSQSTCVAVSDALLSGYSRDSVCVDMMSLTQPGDGHCGYFRPFRYNGGWFGYSLYGGAYHSRNGFWRSRDGINWMLDPRLSCQRQDVMTGWDDYGQLYTCLLNHGQMMLWNDDIWYIGCAGAPDSAGSVAYKHLVSVKMAPDLMRFAGPVYDITPDDIKDYETTNLIFQVGNIIKSNGKAYMAYRYGGPKSGFALMEIY